MISSHALYFITCIISLQDAKKRGWCGGLGGRKFRGIEFTDMMIIICIHFEMIYYIAKIRDNELLISVNPSKFLSS